MKFRTFQESSKSWVIYSKMHYGNIRRTTRVVRLDNGKPFYPKDLGNTSVIAKGFYEVY